MCGASTTIGCWLNCASSIASGTMSRSGKPSIAWAQKEPARGRRCSSMPVAAGNHTDSPSIIDTAAIGVSQMRAAVSATYCRADMPRASSSARLRRSLSSRAPSAVSGTPIKGTVGSHMLASCSGRVSCRVSGNASSRARSEALASAGMRRSFRVSQWNMMGRSAWGDRNRRRRPCRTRLSITFFYRASDAA